MPPQPPDRITDHVRPEQRQELERFAGLEERLGQLHGMLKVNIVVREPMDEEDRAAQLGCDVARAGKRGYRSTSRQRYNLLIGARRGDLRI